MIASCVVLKEQACVIINNLSLRYKESTNHEVEGNSSIEAVRLRALSLEALNLLSLTASSIELLPSTHQ